MVGAATTLDGKLANRGLLGPKVAIGDRLDAINDALAIINQQMRTRAYTSGALAEGTSAAKIKTTAVCNYSIDGVLYSKAATDDLSLTAAAAQAVLTDCAYLICLDSGGTLSSVKGTEVATGGTLVVPAPVSASVCPIGYIKVALAGAATFTANTTDFSAANVTVTYFNLAQLPATTTGSVALNLPEAI